MTPVLGTLATAAIAPQSLLLPLLFLSFRGELASATLKRFMRGRGFYYVQQGNNKYERLSDDVEIMVKPQIVLDLFVSVFVKKVKLTSNGTDYLTATLREHSLLYPVKKICPRIRGGFECNSSGRFLSFSGRSVLITRFRIEGYETFVELFAGCYSDSGDTMVAMEQVTNVGRCLRLCKNNKFAAVMNLQCTCTNTTYGLERLGLQECDHNCPTGTMCGRGSIVPLYFTNISEITNAHAPKSSCILQNRDCDVCGPFHEGPTCLNPTCGRCSPAGCELKVDDNMNSSVCLCGVGHDPQFWGSCVDIDECEYDACPVHSSRCSNFVGGFDCLCRSGFRQINKTWCSDVDECAMNVCDLESTECDNGIGSFRCLCKIGYEPINATHCRDSDECSFASACDLSSSVCENLPGLYLCNCFDGFVQSTTLSCTDVDECISSPCDGLATCLNSPGTYRCGCPVGFILINFTYCEDIDECEDSHPPCLARISTCLNLVGTYICMCHLGYHRQKDNICTDIDECATRNLCDNGSTECQNTIGSYLCSCMEGFERTSSFKCSDVNECLMKLDNCDHTSKCVNTPGGFDCICKKGMTLQKYQGVCIDIDECTEVKPRCSEDQFCVNVHASYRCVCYVGEPIGPNNACIKVTTKKFTGTMTTGKHRKRADFQFAPPDERFESRKRSRPWQYAWIIGLMSFFPCLLLAGIRNYCIMKENAERRRLHELRVARFKRIDRDLGQAGSEENRTEDNFSVGTGTRTEYDGSASQVYSASETSVKTF